MAQRRQRQAKGDTVDRAMAPLRRALAARVSTEDQAERGTIKAQLDYLRSRTELDNKAREMQGLPPIVVVDEYLDDGISGAVPLGGRPDGKRLVEDARAGLFDQVMWYRLDRMGRSLAVLMDAHDQFERAGVTVVSATEPFDTSTPFGKAMFQFLGLIAELEKSTIADRMNSGRDRAVRGGKWTNGLVPFGYDLDDDGCLIPSERIVAGTGMTEAQIAREVFERLAHRAGETLYGVCRWLDALGVPTASRFRQGTVWTRQAAEWKPSRVYQMVHRSLYSGVHTFNSASGPITREVPALVGREVQAAAIARLEGNARLPSTAARFNLLRGLVVCGSCGLAYVGVHVPRRGGTSAPYYRCNGSLAHASVKAEGRCRSKRVPAQELESRVVAYVRSLAEDPGAEIEEARRVARAKTGQSVGLDVRREALARRLGELAAERDQIMTLFKRGRITLDEAERQLDDTAQTMGAAKAELEGLRSQQELADATEKMVLSAAAALRYLAEEFERVPPERQREIIGAIIPKIVVHTVELGAREGRSSKAYDIEVQPVLGLGMGEVASTVPTHNESHYPVDPSLGRPLRSLALSPRLLP